jgi:hypothetical protein
VFPLCFTTTASPEIFAKRLAALREKREKLAAEILALLE